MRSFNTSDKKQRNAVKREAAAYRRVEGHGAAALSVRQRKQLVVAAALVMAVALLVASILGISFNTHTATAAESSAFNKILNNNIGLHPQWKLDTCLTAEQGGVGDTFTNKHYVWRANVDESNDVVMEKSPSYVFTGQEKYDGLDELASRYSLKQGNNVVFNITDSDTAAKVWADAVAFAMSLGEATPIVDVGQHKSLLDCPGGGDENHSAVRVGTNVPKGEEHGEEQGYYKGNFFIKNSEYVNDQPILGQYITVRLQADWTARSITTTVPTTVSGESGSLTTTSFNYISAKQNEQLNYLPTTTEEFTRIDGNDAQYVISYDIASNSCNYDNENDKIFNDSCAFSFGRINVPTGVYIVLDLNGHTINRGLGASSANYYGSVFHIGSEARLEIMDSTAYENASSARIDKKDGADAGANSAGYKNKDNNIHISNHKGTITGGYTSTNKLGLDDAFCANLQNLGGGFNLSMWADLVVHSGTISNNMNSNGSGGAFYQRSKAAVTIFDGYVLDNQAVSGGVTNLGSGSGCPFTMYGGVLAYNLASNGNGGAVNLAESSYGNFHGGEIMYNEATGSTTVNEVPNRHVSVDSNGKPTFYGCGGAIALAGNTLGILDSVTIANNKASASGTEETSSHKYSLGGGGVFVNPAVGAVDQYWRTENGVTKYAFKFRGSLQIFNNTAGGDTDNVHLGYGFVGKGFLPGLVGKTLGTDFDGYSKIGVGGSLFVNGIVANVGVTVGSGATGTLDFTSGYGTYNPGREPYVYFFSDSNSYYVDSATVSSTTEGKLTSGSPQTTKLVWVINGTGTDSTGTNKTIKITTDGSAYQNYGEAGGISYNYNGLTCEYGMLRVTSIEAYAGSVSGAPVKKWEINKETKVITNTFTETNFRFKLGDRDFVDGNGGADSFPDEKSGSTATRNAIKATDNSISYAGEYSFLVVADDSTRYVNPSFKIKINQTGVEASSELYYKGEKVSTLGWNTEQNGVGVDWNGDGTISTDEEKGIDWSGDGKIKTNEDVQAGIPDEQNQPYFVYSGQYYYPILGADYENRGILRVYDSQTKQYHAIAKNEFTGYVLQFRYANAFFGTNKEIDFNEHSGAGVSYQTLHRQPGQIQGVGTYVGGVMHAGMYSVTFISANTEDTGAGEAERKEFAATGVYYAANNFAFDTQINIYVKPATAEVQLTDAAKNDFTYRGTAYSDSDVLLFDNTSNTNVNPLFDNAANMEYYLFDDLTYVPGVYDRRSKKYYTFDDIVSWKGSEDSAPTVKFADGRQFEQYSAFAGDFDSNRATFEEYYDSEYAYDTEGYLVYILNVGEGNKLTAENRVEGGPLNARQYVVVITLDLDAGYDDYDYVFDQDSSHLVGLSNRTKGETSGSTKYFWAFEFTVAPAEVAPYDFDETAADKNTSVTVSRHVTYNGHGQFQMPQLMYYGFGAGIELVGTSAKLDGSSTEFTGIYQGSSMSFSEQYDYVVKYLIKEHGFAENALDYTNVTVDQAKQPTKLVARIYIPAWKDEEGKLTGANGNYTFSADAVDEAHKDSDGYYYDITYQIDPVVVTLSLTVSYTYDGTTREEDFNDTLYPARPEMSGSVGNGVGGIWATNRPGYTEHPEGFVYPFSLVKGSTSGNIKNVGPAVGADTKKYTVSNPVYTFSDATFQSNNITFGAGVYTFNTDNANVGSYVLNTLSAYKDGSPIVITQNDKKLDIGAGVVWILAFNDNNSQTSEGRPIYSKQGFNSTADKDGNYGNFVVDYAESTFAVRIEQKDISDDNVFATHIQQAAAGKTLDGVSLDGEGYIPVQYETGSSQDVRTDAITQLATFPYAGNGYGYRPEVKIGYYPYGTNGASKNYGTPILNLVKGDDYSLEWMDNSTVSVNTDGHWTFAQVLVTGKQNYTGAITVSFRIRPAQIKMSHNVLGDAFTDYDFAGGEGSYYGFYFDRASHQLQLGFENVEDYSVYHGILKNSRGQDVESFDGPVITTAEITYGYASKAVFDAIAYDPADAYFDESGNVKKDKMGDLKALYAEASPVDADVYYVAIALSNENYEFQKENDDYDVYKDFPLIKGADYGVEANNLARGVFEIKPAEVKASTGVAAETYNRSEHNVSVTFTNNRKVDVNVIPSLDTNEYSVTYSCNGVDVTKVIDAGKYRGTVNVNTHEWFNFSSLSLDQQTTIKDLPQPVNFTLTAGGEFDFTVEAAEIDVNEFVKGVYNGETQTPALGFSNRERNNDAVPVLSGALTSVLADEYTVTYSGAGLDGSLPKNAGKYTVSVRLANGALSNSNKESNFKFVTSDGVTVKEGGSVAEAVFVIDPATVSMQITGASITFDGYTHVPEFLTEADPSKIQFSFVNTVNESVLPTAGDVDLSFEYTARDGSKSNPSEDECIHVGSYVATVTITKGNFIFGYNWGSSGQQENRESTISYTILPHLLTLEDLHFTFGGSGDVVPTPSDGRGTLGSMIYTSQATLPTLKVIVDGVKDSQLTENEEYTYFAVTSDVNVGTVRLTIIGMEDYTGTLVVTYDIEKATVNVTVSAEDKTYDGTTKATVTFEVDGAFDSDLTALQQALNLLGVFEDEDVSLIDGVPAEKTVNVKMFAVASSLLNNYKILYNGEEIARHDVDDNDFDGETTSATAQAVISPARITGITGIKLGDKTYDGGVGIGDAKGQFDYSGVVFVVDGHGLYNNDDVKLTINADDPSNAFYNDATAGSGKMFEYHSDAVTLYGADSSNYVLAFPDDTLYIENCKIVRREISVKGGFSVDDKVYDGNTAAAVRYDDGTNLAVTENNIVGLVEGDDVKISVTARFGSKNVWYNGGDDAVAYTYQGQSASGDGALILTFVLFGDDAGNYLLTSEPYTGSSVGATITRRTLSVSVEAKNKVYDGSNSAQIQSVTLEGLIQSEQGFLVASTEGITATFDDKNVGTRKLVTVPIDYSIVQDAPEPKCKGTRENYYFAETSLVAYADITPKPVTIGESATFDRKQYDGTKNAVVLSHGTLDGVLTADQETVILTASGEYDYKDVRDASSIRVTYVMSGSGARNYTFDAQGKDFVTTNDGGSMAGSIAPAQVNVHWMNTEFTYTGKPLDLSQIAYYVKVEEDGGARVYLQVASFEKDGVKTKEFVDAGKYLLKLVDADGEYQQYSKGVAEALDSNYTLTGDLSKSYEIAKAVVTIVGLAILAKAYDNTTVCPEDNVTWTGVSGIDPDLVGKVKAVFKDKTVGTHNVDIFIKLDSNHTLEGGEPDPDGVDTYVITAMGQIVKREVAVKWQGGNFTYDATDKLSAITATWTDAENKSNEIAFTVKEYNSAKPVLSEAIHSGMYKVVVNGLDGELADCYTLTNTEYIFTIVKAKVKVNNISVPNKEFDSNNIAYPDTSAVTFEVVDANGSTLQEGLYYGDELNVLASGTFNGSDVGEHEVTVVVLLGGASIADYELADGEANKLFEHVHIVARKWIIDTSFGSEGNGWEWTLNESHTSYIKVELRIMQESNHSITEMITLENSTSTGGIKLTAHTKREAGCTEDGEAYMTAEAYYGLLTFKYDDSVAHYEEKTIVLPSFGHSWVLNTNAEGDDNNDGWIWTHEGDRHKAEVNLTCTTCGATHKMSAAEVTNPPFKAQCTEDIYVTYSAIIEISIAGAESPFTEKDKIEDGLSATYQSQDVVTVPYTGHDWRIDTSDAADSDGDGWTWSEDFKRATVHFVCDNCGEQHSTYTTSRMVNTPVGCENDGMDEATVSVTREAVVGLLQETNRDVFESIPNDSLTARHTLNFVPATGHSWGTPKWNWQFNGDGYTATATFECDNCHQTRNVEAAVSNVIEPATCTEDGKQTYTATVTPPVSKEGDPAPEAVTEDKVIVIPATGHHWQADTSVNGNGWTWQADGSGATLQLKCDCGETLLLNAEITMLSKQDVSCLQDGYTVYKGLASESDARTQPQVTEKDVFTDVVWENTVQLQHVDALGHSWIVDGDYADSDNGWSWQADGDGKWSAVLHLVCEHDDEHTMAVNAKVVAGEKTYPNCVTEGSITYTASVNLVDDETNSYNIDAAQKTSQHVETIAPRGHSWVLDTDYPGSARGWEWHDAANSVVAHFKCEHDCGTMLDITVTTDNSAAYHVSDIHGDVTLTVEVSGRIEITATGATCTVGGGETRKAEITLEGSVFSNEHIVEESEPLGHSWIADAETDESWQEGWEWKNVDGEWQATLHLKCERCGELTSFDAVVVKSDRTEPGCTTAGSQKYTAVATVTVEYDGEKTSSFTETLLATGHKFTDDPQWSWELGADGHYTVTATFKCAQCKEATLTVVADTVGIVSQTLTLDGSSSSDYDISGKIVVNAESTPSCTEPGVVSLSVSLQVEGNTFNSSFRQEDAVLGHVFDGEPQHHEAGGRHYHVYTCTRCGEEQLEEDCTFDETVTEPTCDDDGYTTYTCTRCGYNYQEDGASATGHELYAVWGEWNSETHTVEAELKCRKCEFSFTPNVVVTAEMLSPACEENGERTYKASFAYGSETYENPETLTETVAATGHNWVIDGSTGNSGWTWEHDPVSDEWTATAHFKCTNDGCGETRSIEATVNVRSQPATCTSDRLDMLDASVSFDGAVYTATHTEYIEGTQTDHVYDRFVHVYEGGEHKHEIRCSICNQLQKTEECTFETDKSDPTCTNGGYTRQKCTQCGYVLSGSEKYFDAKGHQWTVDAEAEEDTDGTADGWLWQLQDDGSYKVTVYLVCSECDVKESAEASVDSRVTVAPTCQLNGTRVYTATASKDDKEFTSEFTTDEPADPDAHTWILDVGYPESDNGWTWTADGNGQWSATAHFKCANCTATHTETDSDPQEIRSGEGTCDDPHKISYKASVTLGTETYESTKVDEVERENHNWVIDVASGDNGWTWTGSAQDGYTAAVLHLICTKCNDVRDVEAHIEVKFVPATCQDGSYNVYTAFATFEGGDLFYESKEGVHATTLGEHLWGEWQPVTPATCTEAGTEQRTCSVCGETQTQSTVPLGHRWSDWTLSADGKTESRSCEVCGATETKPVGGDHVHSWAEDPTWQWNEDHSVATATFTCTLCGHQEVVDATVTSEDKGEYTTYTAMVEFEGDSYFIKVDISNANAPTDNIDFGDFGPAIVSMVGQTLIMIVAAIVLNRKNKKK